MTDKYVIYHNARCSKSRETLQLLRDAGVEPEIVHYLEMPPSADELARLVSMLGLPASKIVRFNEALARELGLSSEDSRSDAEWCALLHAHPVLIERPIVVRGSRAVLGRPPAQVRALL